MCLKSRLKRAKSPFPVDVRGLKKSPLKGATSRATHVRDLRSPSWSNELSVILDLREIRRFLRFFVRLAP